MSEQYLEVWVFFSLFATGGACAEAKIWISLSDMLQDTLFPIVALYIYDI